MRGMCSAAAAALTLLIVSADGRPDPTEITGVLWTALVLWCADAILSELGHMWHGNVRGTRALHGITLPSLALATGMALPVGVTAQVLLLQALLYAAARPLGAQLARPRRHDLRVALMCTDEEAAAVWSASREGLAPGTTVTPVLQVRVQDGAEVPASSLADLSRRCAFERVDVVLVGCSARRDPQVVQTLRVLRRAGVRQTDLTAWFEQLFQRTPLVGLDPAAAMQAPSRFGRLRPRVGRAGTLLVAVPLTVLLALLLPLVAAAIVADSGRPVLFRQRRVGLGSQPFDILKFRTMRQDAESDGARFTSVGDARVTRVGQFLRRTRLDELPQVLNMLRGEMTLIGPRPERPEFVAEYEQCLPGYRARHIVRPGLTGWAQVTEGYTSSVDGTRRKLERDLFYVRHRSSRLHALILLRTVTCVLRMSGR